jgi:hypothetical protein
MRFASIRQNFDIIAFGTLGVAFVAALIYDAATNHFIVAELVERLLG